MTAEATLSATPPFSIAQQLKALIYSGDIRMLLMASRTFVMQLAHPAVGAGVMQHSKFREDPWSRLREIAYSGNQITFGDHASASREGARLRDLHRDIKGIDQHGQRYHALHPRTYGWVHFIFLESTLTAHALFAKPIPASEQQMLFQQWRDSGHYFGLRDQDLPRTLDQYWRYYDEMMATTLEYNDAIDYIIHVEHHTPPPPPQLSAVPHWLWPTLWKPMGRFGTLMTIGSLPDAYRQKFRNEIHWDSTNASTFEKQQQWIRNLINPLPLRLKLVPQAYRKYLELKQMSG